MKLAFDVILLISGIVSLGLAAWAWGEVIYNAVRKYI